MPRYQSRHRAPGRHKAKRHPLADTGPWRKTFAAVTGASLGVTGVIAGGAYLSSGLKEQANQSVLHNPQNLSALGARAVDIDDRRNDERVDRSERSDESARQESARTAGAEAASAASELAGGGEQQPAASPEDDSLATATVNDVIDRSAAEARRAEEREQELREQLESSDPRTIAQGLLEQRGMGADEFSCLDSLWTKESGWNPQARNPSSGAYGIPQALPGSKMAEFGDDWEWNPRTQIEWGLWYIGNRYGTPCSAWAHSQSTGWY